MFQGGHTKSLGSRPRARLLASRLLRSLVVFGSVRPLGYFSVCLGSDLCACNVTGTNPRSALGLRQERHGPDHAPGHGLVDRDGKYTQGSQFSVYGRGKRFNLGE